MERISLKAARIEAELTLTEAAKKLGIAAGTLGAYERYVRKPSLDVIQRIIALYGRPFEAIRWTRKDQ